MGLIMAIGNNNITMTSREIADMVEKRHDNVKRTIETLSNNGVIQSPQIVNFKNINNVEGSEFIFTGEQGKRDSIIVVAQLSPEFTARLVDRWQELEKKAQPVIHDPSTRALIQLLTEQDALKQRVTLLEAKTTTRDESYFTAAGFCNLKGIKLDRAAMSMLGKLAAQYSRDNGIAIGKVYDSRYGEVNEYHVAALQHAANV